MRRFHAVRSTVLATVLGGALVLPCRSQTIYWTDQTGIEHSSEDPRSVPHESWPLARCVARGIAARDGERFEITGGHLVRLIGVDAPDRRGADPQSAVVRARKRLDALIRDRVLTLRFDRTREDGRHATWAYAFAPDGSCINETLLREGTARLRLATANQRRRSALVAAQSAARAARRGPWSDPSTAPSGGPSAAHAGFSLGLYSRDPEHDYGGYLRELAALGARDVLLITPWFMHDHRSLAIEPRRHRSCPLTTVLRTIRQARDLGLRVGLMPIVLLYAAPEDKWRGNVEPSDLEAWFSAYDEFILRFADAARAGGADLLVVGSEFSSLERHEVHWRRVIADVRARFDGELTYSANWDHLTTIRFWDALDLVGMTGYHSLTKKNDPTVAELTAAWRKIRADLERVVGDKPHFFTEVGYASLDGINKNPWDYVSPKVVDLREQADCYRAFLAAWANAGPNYRGAYFYTWWRNRDPDDVRQYTVYGKPAERVLRDYFSSLGKKR